ncbi:hypothetical protein RBH29_08615 [Herbivorax sp. ANBcel31]|uniref:hypothetical protein n=1 Tax=Herbivorax sp. ANBcel31 TaxID=3069754 RepID=UPI0027AF46C5|nr:hypothetical protein [Herbivorax sp. ANBcel31]MDQ2086488.1 hypothetical protein [Herbivorax sp. ANBcel31]
MNSFYEIKEVQEGIQALNEVREALKELKNDIEKSSEFVLSTTNKLQKELEEARDKMDRANAQLISEEMKGKKNQKTVEDVRKHSETVTRLEATLEAVSRAGGISIVLLEKKLPILMSEKAQAEREELGWKSVPERHVNRKLQKQNIEELAKKIEGLKNEIKNTENALEVLKKNQKKYGKLLLLDADTQKNVDKIINLAVNAWSKRRELLTTLIQRRDKLKIEKEKINNELFLLDEGIEHTNPDYVGEEVYVSKIGSVLFPELFEEVNDDGGSNSDTLKSWIKLKIWRMAREKSNKEK